MKFLYQFCSIILSVILFTPTYLHANIDEEGTFISLTRQAIPIGQLPTNVSIITAEDIKESGAVTIDEVLDLLPSIDLTRNGSLGSFSSIRMRGGTTSAQVQVVVDDQPLGGNAQQFIDLSLIPVENIERIEVVRGGSSVLFGANTLSGVIHIITKRHQGASPEVQLNTEVRSHQTHIASVLAGGSAGPMDATLFIKNFQTDGFQENARARDRSGMATIGFSSGGGHTLSGTVSVNDRENGNPKGTNVPFDLWDEHKERAAADLDARTEKNKREFRLKGAVPLGDVGIIQTQAYGFHDNLQSFANGGGHYTFEQSNRIYGGDARLQFFKGLTLGSAYERDSQETLGRANSHITNWALYSVLDMRNDRIAIIPGLRLDQHSQFGNIYNPRLTILLFMSPKWIVTMNAARSFRSPSFLELFFRSNFFNGNPHLRPETAWTYDFGNEIQLSENRKAKLTGYYSRIRDRIFATATTYTNLHHAELMGVEFELEGQNGPFRDIINYTYTRARGNSTSSAEFVNLRLTSPHVVNGIFIYDAPNGVSLSNTIQYVAHQFRLNNDRGEKLPSYGLWHARISKTIYESSEVYFGVDNITNKRYAEAFDNDPNTFSTTFVPAPDRTFWAGVKIKFPAEEAN